jgi:hypothetical protein
MKCPSCKQGKQSIKVTTITDKTAESVVEVTCIDCAGDYEMDQARYDEIVTKKQRMADAWCRCDEPGEPVYYEFFEDGRRYHGYDCSKCGKVQQTG